MKARDVLVATRGLAIGRRRVVAAVAFLAFLSLTVAFAVTSPATALADNPPTLTTDPASNVGVSTARLSGAVNPHGEAGAGNTTWKIQYRLAGEEAFTDASTGTIEAPASEAASPVAVEVIAGFESGQTYEFRILAENGAATVRTPAPYPTFTMDPVTAPALSVEAPTAPGYTTATLHGTLDPEGGNANPSGPEVMSLFWQFQVSLDPATEGWAGVGDFGEISASEPEGGGPVPALGDDPVALQSTLAPGTLKAGKTYQVRLVSYYVNFSREAISPETQALGTKAAALPTLSPPAASAVSSTTAHLAATVNPGAPEPSAALGEDAKAAFRTEWHFECVAPGPSCGSPSGAAVEADNAAHEVKADLTNLQPNTHYVVKLVASSASGQSESAPGEFAEFTTTAAGPTLGPEVSTPGGPGEVTIRGFVNPRNSTITDCHFDYGPSASYGQSVACEGDPNGPGVAEEPLSHTFPPPARVSAHLTGLDPGATYHFRLVVDNGVGPVVQGEDRIVDVPDTPSAESCPNAGSLGTNFLPDCRAWEMVSPPDKNGGNVLIDTQRTRAADDGNGLVFSSPSGFGDVVGTGVAVDYMSLRRTDANPGTNGWATHTITPPQEPLSVNGALVSDPLYLGDLSPDLSRGVFRAWSPLTSDPNVARVPNFYVRRDLRNPGAGTYELATPCPLCDETSTPLLQFFEPPYVPVYAGASDSFDHVLFESLRNLTSDSPAQASSCADGSNVFSCLPRAYEWDAGQLRLVGQVPSGAETSCGGSNPPCVPAPSSLPGHGVGTIANASRPINAISNDGQRIFFTSSDRVYVRTAHATTDEASASERTDCAADPTCGPNGTPDPAPDNFSPAKYWAASADGSRVFFTTGEALTDQASVGGGSKLYMYDTTKPASDPKNLTLINVDGEPADADNGVNGVIGIGGGGGSYVYFLASGQLVSGAPVIGGFQVGYYMWHEGDISYIGQYVDGDSSELQMTGGDFILRTIQGRVSADGRSLLMSTHSGSGLAIGNDQGSCATGFGVGCRQFYLYRADTNQLSCLSCSPDGAPSTASAETGVRLAGASYTTWHLNRAITDDRRFAFFSSAEALVPEDTNGKSDAYEYDVKTGSLHLLSSGTSASDSYFMEASPDGADAFILTAERLSAWDSDGSFDIYDARINGGFPEPPAVEPPCFGDACRDAVSIPPGRTPSASARFTGPGNSKAKRRCPKGQRQVKGKGGKKRCVKRKRSHGGPKRDSNTDRRTLR